MRKCELEARRGGKSLADGNELNKKISQEHDDLEPLEGVVPNIWSAIIPIGTLIVGALIARCV